MLFFFTDLYELEMKCCPIKSRVRHISTISEIKHQLGLFFWAKRANDFPDIIVEHKAKSNMLKNKPPSTKVVFLSLLCSGHEVGVILLHLDTQ